MFACLTHRPRSGFEIEPSKPYFIFESLFLTRNTVSPSCKYLWQELLNPFITLSCSLNSLFKIRTESWPPSRKGKGWYCANTHLYWRERDTPNKTQTQACVNWLLRCTLKGKLCCIDCTETMTQCMPLSCAKFN